MFKKKKKNADTPADLQLKELYYPFIDLRDEFYSTIRKVIVKEEVIKIYPDGADKDAAIKDYHFEQQYLLVLIGKYDDLRNQISNFIKNNKEERHTTAYWEIPQTSHETIETIYKRTKGMW